MTTIDRLNAMCQQAKGASLGTRLDAILTLVRELHDDHATFRTVVNDLKTYVNTINNTVDGILAKLDADGGVTDANYAALWGTGGSEGNKTPADVSTSTPATLTASKPSAL